ncbi:MAG: aminotransferase class V-fold PLP-dependent enzyme [Firmicutes bacterium]|nr:aminotransferase class V-fold PLP-dependent enzyme [Candidatus Fermentithermobacillaceae bacterium]
MTIEGNRFRHLWPLDSSFTFLNHGSYGAVPNIIIEAQNELHLHIESQPVRFFGREIESMLDEARVALSSFLDADSEGIVFVPNATTGVNTVLKSLRFSHGDEIVITNHIYNACRNAVNTLVQKYGVAVRTVEIPLPIQSKDSVLISILNAVTNKTKLVLVDHVTSPTAVVFPIEELASILSSRGIDVLVDGAHAPGMIPLSIRNLPVAYYTGNCHKWLCCPKGSAFLYVRKDRRNLIRPLVTSHGANSTRTDKSSFHLEFDWTGTDDYTPYILIPRCIDFLDSLLPGGWTQLAERNHQLVLQASDILSERLKTQLQAPRNMIGSMACIPFAPLDNSYKAPGVKYSDPIQDLLFHEYKIEVPVVTFEGFHKRMVRLSAHAYNSIEDYVRLALAIEEIVGS